LDLTEFSSIASLVLVLGSLLGLAVWAGIRRARAEEERSARSALVDELEARRMAADRLGREADEARAKAAELKKSVEVLEARTDLTAFGEESARRADALSAQIAKTTEATLGAIEQIVEDHDRRATERAEKAELRADERHKEIIGLIGSMSSLMTQSALERRT
jgi:hypothetical protein